MRRTIVAGAMIAIALAVVGIPSAALAGAGCHGSMTEADATGEDEATVTMVDQCFEASVLRVDPGTSVTFVHEDAGITHNVGGTEWGFYGDMRKGDTFTSTFDDPGVYPFACSYHPGMTGAIVVGDGYGAGTGWSVMSTEPTKQTAQERPAPAPAAATGDDSALAMIGIGALGLALGAGVAFGIGRVRRTAAA